MKVIFLAMAATAVTFGIVRSRTATPVQEAVKLGTFAPAPSETPTKKHRIQVALLLDTSNSMDGLIDQAKSQLWKLVNELATSKKEGETPDIEIALFNYGNSGLDASKGYIEQVIPLSRDLDKVSEKLFAFKTNGGDEYCGHVIQDAVRTLDWTNSRKDLKMIFIAGNEPFTQGSIDYKKACAEACEKGILVNTIHCGSYEQGVQDKWKDGADICKGGKYMNIDQDKQVVHIPTPFDNRLIELNEKLNKTYIGFGKQGVERAEMQQTQDKNAANYGVSNMATRAASKAKQAYSNEEWDLVDAKSKNKEALKKVKKEELPEEMQKMTEKEREEFIDAKAKERTAIQTEINELDKKRREFEDAERKKLGEDNTLDKVMMESIHIQAKEAGFDFE